MAALRDLDWIIKSCPDFNSLGCDINVVEGDWSMVSGISNDQDSAEIFSVILMDMAIVETPDRRRWEMPYETPEEELEVLRLLQELVRRSTRRY